MMRAILAGAVAAAAALGVNRWAVARWGRPAVIFLVPLIEETAKTCTAVSFGLPLLPVHVVFGAIEAVYDGVITPRRRAAVAAGSLAGHTLYGALTAGTRRLTGNLLLAVGAAVLVHLFWNAVTTDWRYGRKETGRENH